MKSRISSAVWLAVALACGSALSADEIRWAPDLLSARKASAQFKVPVLVHFYGDNCLPCKMLEERVFNRPELIDTLNKYFICVRVNGSQNPATAAQYNVHRWPTDVFLAPDGSTLFLDVSKQDVNNYLGVLHNVAVMNRDRNAVMAASSTASKTTSTDFALQNQAPTQQPTPASQLGANRAAETGNSGFYGARTHDQLAGHLEQATQTRPEITSGPTPLNQQMRSLDGAASQTAHMIVGNNMSEPSGVATATHPTQQGVASATATSHLPPRTIQPGTIPTLGTQGQSSLASYNSVPQTPGADTPQAGATSDPAAAAWQQNTANPSVVGNPYMAGGVAQTNPQSSLPDAQTPQTHNPVVARTASQQNAGAAAQVAGSLVAATSAAAAQPSPAVTSPAQPAFEGYCVIEAKRGAWVAGNPELAVRHRGEVYWFSTPQAQQAFLAAPDRAAPLLSGYDPQIFLTTGRLVPGSIQNTLHERVSDQLLLFSSAESKNAYFPNGNEQVFERNTAALMVILQKSQGN